LLTVFPAHAPEDAPHAQEIAAFLESGPDTAVSLLDSVIKPGEDLLAASEAGLSADVLLLMISKASNLPKWPLEEWQSILFTQAADLETTVAVWLLDEARPPGLLLRTVKTFDATGPRLRTLRRLKRWLQSLRLKTDPEMLFSPDLESLYRELADHPGTAKAPGALAERFAREAAGDFDRVFFVPAHKKTLAQIAGELGTQMEMPLDGELEENCRKIRAGLEKLRCLVVFDAPEIPLDPLTPEGRPSVLITTDPVRTEDTPRTLASARRLVAAKRYAEAYEILDGLFRKGLELESCAREMVWICDHWGRYAEASALRNHFRLPPSEQLSLF
jgi:hypothetical protein